MSINSSPEINTGLIGYGFSGANFHAPVLTTVDAVKLYAVASSNPEKVRADWPQAKVYAEPAQMLADPAVELVVIATPNNAHFSLAKAALLAGKHVVIDKPFTITGAEAEDLIACASSGRRLLSVYHNRRWDADFLTLKSLIERGVLGRIVSFESRFDRFRPEVKSRWREEGGPGGGILYDLGPHLIDQALHLFGQPDRLFADLARQRQGAMALDYFHLVLYYDAMRVVLHAGSLVNAPTARFAVHGDKGSFVKFGTDPQEAALRAGGRPGHTGWGKDPIHGELYLSGALPDRHLEMDAGRYQSYYEGIVAAIRRGEPSPVTAEDGLATIRLIEAALLSAEEGRVVTVPISWVTRTPGRKPQIRTI